MSDQVELAIIGMVQVVGLGFLAYLNNRMHSATQNQIEIVRKDVNGKMQELVDSKEGAALARGNLTGRAEAKQEAKQEAEEAK